jgi:hypothetical protein
MNRRRAVAAPLMVLLAAFAIAGCGSAIASPSLYTAVPIGPTAWPSGTVGQYGLKIDPSLLGRLPQFVGAEPVSEDPLSESGALDDQDLARSLDRYAAATIGEIGDADWVKVALAQFRTEDLDPDVYLSWVDQYADGACSQASGVVDTGHTTISGFEVDTAECSGDLSVYTLSLGKGLVLSLYEFGPKHLGRKLIETLY